MRRPLPALMPIPGDGAPGTSLISGLLPDQAALRSVLNRLWDLNLEVEALAKWRG